jgi:hypothetical protein
MAGPAHGTASRRRPAGGCRARPPHTYGSFALSLCTAAYPLVFVPCLLTYSVPLLLKRRCDRALRAPAVLGDVPEVDEALDVPEARERAHEGARVGHVAVPAQVADGRGRVPAPDSGPQGCYLGLRNIFHRDLQLRMFLGPQEQEFHWRSQSRLEGPSTACRCRAAARGRRNRRPARCRGRRRCLAPPWAQRPFRRASLCCISDFP